MRPRPSAVLEFARIWRALPKIVFSRSLEAVEGNTRLLRDGLGEEVARLKAQEGNDLASAGRDSPARAPGSG